VETELSIYTDGGCSDNPGPGGWAYVILSEGNPIARHWGAEMGTTNNRMEVRAVISAMEYVQTLKPPPAKITVYTDSQYVQKGMSQWIYRWKRNGWLTHDRKPVSNQDLWKRLDVLSEGRTIYWIWIRGHAGAKYNEECDRMTQDAIRSISPWGRY
jgi:ribonuclease HI